MVAQALRVDRGSQPVQHLFVRHPGNRHFEIDQDPPQQTGSHHWLSKPHFLRQVRHHGMGFPVFDQQIPQDRQRQGACVPVRRPQQLCNLVAHGVGCGRPGRIDGLSALQVVQHAPESQERVDPAVLRRPPGPVAFDSLAQRVQRTGFFMVIRQAVQQPRIQDHTLRQQRRMAQAQLLSVFIYHSGRGGFRPAARRSGNRQMRNPAFPLWPSGPLLQVPRAGDFSFRAVRPGMFSRFAFRSSVLSAHIQALIALAVSMADPPPMEMMPSHSCVR